MTISSFPDPMREQPCCDEDTGGSHYHCGRCGKVGGMQGCYGNYDAVMSTMAGKRKEGRGWGFYCPEPFGFATVEQFAAERAAAK